MSPITETLTVWPAETTDGSATLRTLYPYQVRDASGTLDYYRTRSAALYVARMANRGTLGYRPHASVGSRFQPHTPAAPIGASVTPSAHVATVADRRRAARHALTGRA